MLTGLVKLRDYDQCLKMGLAQEHKTLCHTRCTEQCCDFGITRTEIIHFNEWKKCAVVKLQKCFWQARSKNWRMQYSENNLFTSPSEQPRDKCNDIFIDLTQSSLQLFIGTNRMQPIEDSYQETLMLVYLK